MCQFFICDTGKNQTGIWTRIKDYVDDLPEFCDRNSLAIFNSLLPVTSVIIPEGALFLASMSFLTALYKNNSDLLANKTKRTV